MQALRTPCQHHHQVQQQQNSCATAFPHLLHLQHLSHHSRVRCQSVKHNFYSVLGVDYTADASTIKAAFRAKAKVTHPDVNQAEDAEAAFRLLKRAHEVLSDSMLRAAYDTELREQQPDAAAALRAKDPRFARFERWRREIMPDLNAQLDVWTQEVMHVLHSADAVLTVLEKEYHWHLVQGAPSAGTSLDWQGLTQGSSMGSGSWSSSNKQGATYTVQSMKHALAEALANVQRLHDKRYEQMQTRFPAYPDLVWYDRWLEVSDDWLDASGRLAKKWQPKITAAAQWLPAAARVQ